MELIVNKFAELKNRQLVTPSDIIGKNGAGKSSIMNAYLWALTGCDKTGAEMREAVYSVKDKAEERSADVEVRFSDVTFRKVCQPVYMRKKGSDEMTLKSLCANTYYINGAEVTQANYNAQVNKLCNSHPFQLFSDINYFANLKKDRQLAIFMEMLGVNRDQYFKDLRDIKEIKSDISHTKTTIANRDEWLQQEKQNLEKIERPADYSEKIAELKNKIEAIQSQRPTLVDWQIVANDVTTKKIAKLQAETFPPYIPATAKQNALENARKRFNELLSERNDETRKKIERDQALETAKKKLAQTEANAEYDENNAEYVTIKTKIAQYEQKLTGDRITLENYDTLAEGAPCGICPHCVNLFCAERKTDIEPKPDILARIEQMENKVAELRAAAHELKERHEQTINETITTLKNQIAELEKITIKQNPEFDTIQPEIERLEEEAKNEAAENENARKDYEKKRKEFEDNKALKLLELINSLHFAQTARDDNQLYLLKSELAQLEPKQREADEINGHRKGLSNSIARCTAELSELTLQLSALERELMKYERAEEKYRRDIMAKANEVLPEGMSVNLFRPLVTGDGYENIFELTYDSKLYKNTALEIKGNFDLTVMFQKQFGVNLPIFVDDMANITDEEFIPKGDDIVRIIAVAAEPLSIVPTIN